LPEEETGEVGQIATGCEHITSDTDNATERGAKIQEERAKASWRWSATEE
jgi:hypothetical protein